MEWTLIVTMFTYTYTCLPMAGFLYCCKLETHSWEWTVLTANIWDGAQILFGRENKYYLGGRTNRDFWSNKDRKSALKIDIGHKQRQDNGLQVWNPIIYQIFITLDSIRNIFRKGRASSFFWPLPREHISRLITLKLLRTNFRQRALCGINRERGNVQWIWWNQLLKCRHYGPLLFRTMRKIGCAFFLLNKSK